MSDDRVEARPLHDILCEAAGYLVKLGTNLQLRAERLRQRKLSTKHSVRKVTDKVLLICDLSKKSIEKVEDVVRDGVSKEGKIERLVSSDTVAKSSGRVEKAKLQKVGKLLVRIPKRVNLAHFQSCQVRARALPLSVLEKYPINFHCKTWKARQSNILQKDVSVYKNDMIVSTHKPRSRKSSSSDVQENTHEKLKPRRKISSDEESSVGKFSCSESKKNIEDKHLSKSVAQEESTTCTPKTSKTTCSALLKLADDDIVIRSQNNRNEKSPSKSESNHIFQDEENAQLSKLVDDDVVKRSNMDNHEKSHSKTKSKPHFKDREKAQNPQESSNVRAFSDSEKDNKGDKEKSIRNSNNYKENSKMKPTDKQETANKSETIMQSNKIFRMPKEDEMKTKEDDVITKENGETKEPVSKRLLHNKLETDSFKNTPESKKHTASCSSDEDQAITTKKKEASNYNSGKENNKTGKITTQTNLFAIDNNSDSSSKNKSSENLDSVKGDSVMNQPETCDNKSSMDTEKSTIECLNRNPVKADSQTSDDSENSCKDRPKEKGTPKKRCIVLTISSSDDDARDENISKSGNQKSLSSSQSQPSLSTPKDPADILTIEKKNCILEGEKTSAQQTASEQNTGFKSSANSESVCSGDETASQKSSESNRPIIKCIDLNKLLKSPLKETNSLLVETHSVPKLTEESKHIKSKLCDLDKISNTAVNQLRRLQKKKHQPHSKPKKKDTLDKYWKEISAEQALELRGLRMKFIAKKFTINVEKMSSFTNKFLAHHGLRQISQEGTILVKLSKEGSQVNSSAKTDLLNESSDSSQSTECVSRKCSAEKLSRRKHIMESIRAKRLLLTYSSSSETDEDHLKDKSKGLKHSVLTEISSGDENKDSKGKINESIQKECNEKDANQLEDVNKKLEDKEKQKTEEELKNKSEAHKRKLLDSSSSSISDEDTIDSALNMLEKEMQVGELGDNISTLSGEEKNKENKICDEHENQKTDDSDKRIRGNEREGSKTSSISQVDGNDDGTTGSDSEMGRTTRSRATASAQSSDTTDNEDRTIDGLTNLKSLHQKNRSRESPSSMNDHSKSKKQSKADSKVTSLKDDVLLEAESKSSSDVESEDAPATSGLNGQPISELARADLLGEDSDSTQDTANQSDDASSKSNGKAKADNKKRPRKGKPGTVIELDSTDPDQSDEEENLKVRRRKPEVISSDSETGGGSKKKKKAEKDSDYENRSAESDDSAGQFKKSKRKAKKSSDSDSSGSADGRKKKRRRIKQVKESEGSDESGSENDGKKGGRKNIRKVMGKDQLEEATKKAAREERERMARIAERQKQYNNSAFDESGKPDEVILDKVVLDFDPETKEPLIQVDPGIVKKLKPHQANGIKFMWDACFESAKQIKRGRGSGCILAHCMGLGKTLQVVSLTHTLLAHEKLTGVRRVLVVCPLSTVLNWVSEFRMWTEHAAENGDIDIYELSRYKQNHERSHQLKEWMETGGVCVLGYEMFRNLSADNPKKFRKKMLSIFQESLVNPGPDLVVCDEGHLLKNEKTSLSQSMNRVRTLRRIVLTGTPLQNNLKEYYCMVQFVKPNLLGKYNEYLNRFVNPITNGQYTNSTEQDIRVMKRRSHVLHKMLDGAVQRRDYGVLAPFLPPKHEYVLFITLTEVQIKLYQHYLDNYSRRQQAGGRSSGFLFPDFQALQRIWTHPLVLKANSERYEIAQQKKRDREEEEDSEGSLVDFLDDDSTPEESTSEEESDISDISNDSRKKSKKKSNKKSKSKSEPSSSKRSTRANPDAKAEELDMKDLKDPDEPRLENPTEWWIKLVEDKELEDMRNSNKLMLLFDILRQCEAIGDKLLVFSQSLYSLDLIEQFLSRIDDATQAGKVEESLGNHVGSWSPGLDYFRLDGSTSCENRSIWCKSFNREDNPRARLFLISTRAGGLGINLVAANRVVIFDVSWNPSHDVQSIFRVYRFGQKKPCYVYRFLAMGTMEEKIYERQVTKQAISKRVIDEQQIDRHYNENDLQELYTFQPVPEQPRPVPLLPKDRLFAEMLKDHEKLIYRYHEHDSLLENKEEETLTEEERKAAWEDFENEKNRPPPAPFPSVATGFMPPMNGMNNLLQQQLALATMLSMLRKDYPGLSEQQMANLLPQLLYADPSLMQNMRALSNIAGGNMMAGGLGGAGAAGFQPSWQQQQQIQLQRIQQQQAAMSAAGGPGVKYYAGGLGSRDPMSMALQQKHQREMMLNSTGDRLRDMLVGAAGPHAQRRAALHPAAAPTHPAEVVNLDDSE